MTSKGRYYLHNINFKFTAFELLVSKGEGKRVTCNLDQLVWQVERYTGKKELQK